MKFRPPAPAAKIEINPNPPSIIVLVSPEYEAIPAAMTEVISKKYPMNM